MPVVGYRNNRFGTNGRGLPMQFSKLISHVFTLEGDMELYIACLRHINQNLANPPTYLIL